MLRQWFNGPLIMVLSAIKMQFLYLDEIIVILTTVFDLVI